MTCRRDIYFSDRSRYTYSATSAVLVLCCIRIKECRERVRSGCVGRSSAMVTTATIEKRPPQQSLSSARSCWGVARSHACQTPPTSSLLIFSSLFPERLPDSSLSHDIFVTSDNIHLKEDSLVYKTGESIVYKKRHCPTVGRVVRRGSRDRSSTAMYGVSESL